MQVFALKGSFASLEPYLPLLFELGASGLEEKEGEVWAYFPTRRELPLPGRWLTLPDEDWLQKWREGLEPVVAGPFVILAPWHEWSGPEWKIVLEPGMAFGTGHHETTRMALEALAASELHGKKLLDVGTGSGILAIAAAMLGAQALGVDTDASVIPAARENARRNGVAPEFRVGSVEAAMPPYDLLVANLYAELHTELAASYARLLFPGGLALITGILAEKENLADAAMRATGFSPRLRRQEGEWVLLGYER
ncbi:50S ribosomal protein L11 methyltransferase [Oceanithermus sp.]